jgi:aryl-alcohol dehydrogenase-like predicted oxidoreductase
VNASDQSVVLGTAQWGLNYGRTNQHGRQLEPDLRALVASARSAGIQLLDTAAGYGDSEARIAVVGAGFSVQTKIAVSGLETSVMSTQFQESRLRLARENIDGLLVHDWDVADMRSRQQTAEFLMTTKEMGLVRRVGVSVYSIAELESFVEVVPELDVVQVPVNLFDQRLDHEPLIARLRAQGVKIQARSVLLQGLIASPGSAGVIGNHPDVDSLRLELPNSKQERLRLALGYVGSRDWVDEIILGVATSIEFEQLWNAWVERKVVSDWSVYASDDVKLLDPRLWPPKEPLNS